MRKCFLKWGSAALLAALSASWSGGFASAQSFLPVYQKGSGEFVLEYEIGGDIEDEEHFFFQPVDIALDGEGNLFVLDLKGYCIKKFDNEGRFLKTFGRQGEGPGEMAGPISVEIYPDGRVFLNDYMNRRFTLFDNDGEYLDSRSLTDFGYRFVTNARIDANGRLYIQTTETDFADVERKTRTLLSRIDFESLTETMVDSATIRQTYSKETSQGVTMVSAPYHAALFWDVSPNGGIVVANSSDYSIKVYSPDLALRREIRYDGERRPISKKDKDEYFAEFEGEDLVRWMQANIDFPKYQPYFDRLMIDSEGYALFLVGQSEDKKTQVFDVFTPEGEFLNRASLPRTHPNAILHRGFIYTIARGDEDPVVRRYRLE